MTNQIANYICQVYSDSNSHWYNASPKEVTPCYLHANITSWDGKRNYLCCINDNSSCYKITIGDYNNRCNIHRGICRHITDIVDAIDYVLSAFD